MDLKLFGVVFFTIFVAEVGDKTQLATLLYAAESGNSKMLIFVAASTALMASAGLAVLGGGLVAQYVNPKVLSWVAGVGFVAIGLWTILRA